MLKLTEDKYNEVMHLADKFIETYKDYRKGQAIFNAFNMYYPEFANELRGTDDDCFYNDSKISLFLSHVVVTPY